MTLTLVPETIEAYASAHSEPVPPLLDSLREETYRKMKSPQMQVGRVEEAFLRILVRLCRAKRVLEIGMFTGYSALEGGSAARAAPNSPSQAREETRKVERPRAAPPCPC